MLQIDQKDAPYCVVPYYTQYNNVKLCGKQHGSKKQNKQSRTITIAYVNKTSVFQNLQLLRITLMPCICNKAVKVVKYNP